MVNAGFAELVGVIVNAGFAGLVIVKGDRECRLRRAREG
jgi:hypothetical protein